MRRALSIPPFDEPARLVAIVAAAERGGWGGAFLWDHVGGFPFPVADAWSILSAAAVRTERILLGTSVTPVARRRPQVLARQTTTVDHLSNGRLILGVGLGMPVDAEFAAFGETSDAPTLAARLDEGLEVLSGLWAGAPVRHHGPHLDVETEAFAPVPAQSPRIPVWVACTPGHAGPVRRAARWDGLIAAAPTPDGMIDPVPAEALRSMVSEVRSLRDGAPFEAAVLEPGPVTPERAVDLEDAGATWVLVTGWLDDIERWAADPAAAGI